jgi:hypothetical protein
MLVPLDSGVVPQYVLSYAGAVRVSRVHPLEVQKLRGLEVVECERLCILPDCKEQLGKERLVGLQDKSLVDFDGLVPRSAYATSSGCITNSSVVLLDHPPHFLLFFQRAGRQELYCNPKTYWQ